MNTQEILDKVKQRNPNEPEFIQAAEEVITSILPVLEKNPSFVKFLRMALPTIPRCPAIYILLSFCIFYY